MFYHFAKCNGTREYWVIWDQSGLPICECAREEYAERITNALNFEAQAMRALRAIGRAK